jgi:RNA polymerase sigma-70 factor (ECF subfamily)
MDDLFLQFQSSPSRETLVALLQGNQDRIYNICFHVLRHPQDAEDAAQEVLFEMTGGCARIQNPAAFRTWVYRVAVNTALNHKRAKASREDLARRRAAMTSREVRPDNSASEVMEALGLVDDVARSLILDHYFEKATLEEMARREGLSVAGIWKRIEQAKGRLKRALIGAGFAATASNLTHALEAVSPVKAPAGLIGSAILSKAAAVAAGGIVVSAKSVSAGVLVAAAFVLLALGAGGGYWAGVKRAAPRDLVKRSEPARAEHSSSFDPPNLPESREVSESAVSSSAPPVAAKSRLVRFREWHASWRAEFENIPDKQSGEFFSHLSKVYEQGPELRKTVLEDVEAFLEFARAPENEECLNNLLGVSLFHHVKQNWGWHREYAEYDRFPPRLMEGLLDLITHGTEKQKLAVVHCGAYLHNHPAPFLDACRSLLASGHEELQLNATFILLGKGLSDEEMAVIRRNTESSRGLELRKMSYQAIGRTATVENVEWLLDRLGQTADAQAITLAGYALRNFVTFQKGIPRELEAKAASSVIQALSRSPSEQDYDDLMYIGMNLPADHAGPILETAVTHAQKDFLRQAATRVRDAFRNGERNSLKLMAEYREGKKGKAN